MAIEEMSVVGKGQGKAGESNYQAGDTAWFLSRGGVVVWPIGGTEKPVGLEFRG